MGSLRSKRSCEEWGESKKRGREEGKFPFLLSPAFSLVFVLVSFFVRPKDAKRKRILRWVSHFHFSYREFEKKFEEGKKRIAEIKSRLQNFDHIDSCLLFIFVKHSV